MPHSSSFVLFPRLPPELRCVIWQQALPDNAPTLYSYTRRRSISIPLTGSDRVGPFRSENDGCNLISHQSSLADVYLELPLFFVNREANRIAAAWAREQGMLMAFCKDRQTHAFLRPYDMDRDTVYIPSDEINQLSSSLPCMFGHVCRSEPSLTRIAVPEEVLYQDSATLAELLDLFLMETLYVIVGIQPGSRDGDEVQRFGGRWELASPQSNMTLVWNRSRGCFHWRDGESVGSEQLHGQMEQAGKELVRTLDWIKVDRFEILPVSAVKTT
ncbi:unnamed protein product [Clonostachys byssicola]|uniref:2EXR domain-containing protein n=1 Tax=Clonostachys byssicola TaxID=160290 RepID=A0A9N9UBC6_9HYPO|nr:unnamed protein product [Clonostachys byssicola]